MNYSVVVARQAAVYVTRLDRKMQARVVARLEQIVGDPYGPHTKPLTNAADRRAARVGHLRIVFAVDEQEHVVRVSDIAPRGEVYRRL